MVLQGLAHNSEKMIWFMTTLKMLKIYGETDTIISNYNLKFLEMKAHYFYLKAL